MAQSYTLSESSIESMVCVPDFGMATLWHNGALSSIVEGICPLGATSAYRGHSEGTNKEFIEGALGGEGSSESYIVGHYLGVTCCINWGKRVAIAHIMLASVYT